MELDYCGGNGETLLGRENLIICRYVFTCINIYVETAAAAVKCVRFDSWRDQFDLPPKKNPKTNQLKLITDR